MTRLNRQDIHQGEEGHEFACIYCATTNVVDQNPDTLVDIRCYSCERLNTINHASGRRSWTQKEDAELARIYPHERSVDVAFQLGRSASAVQQRAIKLGLTKTEEFQNSEKSGRRKKGEKPWNDGLSYIPGGRCKDNWFRKGNLPHNTLEDGAITLRTDKCGRSYPHIRLGLAEWKMLHVHVWEQAHGPAPEGMVIAFKDGDTFNPDLENLELITRAELMARNTIIRYPASLRHQLRLLAKLERKIKQYASE